MEINESIREFKYGSVVLADPNAQFSLTQVRDFFAAAYPQILNAEIEGPEIKGHRSIYTFRRAVGTKGSTAQRFVALNKAISDLVALDRISWFDRGDSDVIWAAEAMVFNGKMPSREVLARINQLHDTHCSVEECPA